MVDCFFFQLVIQIVGFSVIVAGRMRDYRVAETLKVTVLRTLYGNRSGINQLRVQQCEYRLLVLFPDAISITLAAELRSHFATFRFVKRDGFARKCATSFKQLAIVQHALNCHSFVLRRHLPVAFSSSIHTLH